MHADIIDVQNDDPTCKTLKTNIIENKEKTGIYEIHNGMLMKKHKNKLLMYIPHTINKKIFRAMHDDVLAGHCGFAKIYNYLRERYYMPKLYTKLKAYLQQCESCQMFNVTATKPEGLFTNIKPSFPGQWAPNKRIYIDFLGPYTKTPRRKQYIVHIVDHCTRYAMAKPVNNCTTKDALVVLQEWTHIIGFPEEIVSDQGSHFKSSEFKEYVTAIGAKHTFTPTYIAHPNLVERINGILVHSLRNYVAEKHNSWDLYIQSLTSGYNKRVQNSLTMSPHEAMFAVKPRLPIFSQLDTENTPVTADQHFKNMELTRSTAKQKLKNAVKYSTDKANKFRKPPRRYYPGEFILLKRPRQVSPGSGDTTKFLKHYVGPYEVVEKLSDLTYKVKKCDDDKPEITHVLKMKKFFPKSINAINCVTPLGGESSIQIEQETKDQFPIHKILRATAYFLCILAAIPMLQMVRRYRLPMNFVTWIDENVPRES
jgi:hypothetical protein